MPAKPEIPAPNRRRSLSVAVGIVLLVGAAGGSGYAIGSSQAAVAVAPTLVVTRPLPTTTTTTAVTPTSIVTVTVTVPVHDPSDQERISQLEGQVAQLNTQLANDDKVAKAIQAQTNQQATQNFDVGCPMGRAGCQKPY